MYGVNPRLELPGRGGFIGLRLHRRFGKGLHGVQCELFRQAPPPTLWSTCWLRPAAGPRSWQWWATGCLDIAVAAGTEVTSILVMSGETTPQLLAESPTQPDIVVQDLGS